MHLVVSIIPSLAYCIYSRGMASPHHRIGVYVILRDCRRHCRYYHTRHYLVDHDTCLPSRCLSDPRPPAMPCLVLVAVTGRLHHNDRINTHSVRKSNRVILLKWIRLWLCFRRRPEKAGIGLFPTSSLSSQAGTPFPTAVGARKKDHGTCNYMWWHANYFGTGILVFFWCHVSYLGWVGGKIIPIHWR